MLWLNSRDADVTDEIFNAMLARAKVLLPNFDFTTLDSRIYQGEHCSYAAPKTEEHEGNYLEWATQ